MNNDDPEVVCALKDAGIKFTSDEDGIYRVEGVITAERLRWLEGLPRLKQLFIWYQPWLSMQGEDVECCDIEDANLEVLHRWPHLVTLDLSGATNVTDAGLLHLRGLVKVWSLDLPRYITDEGLRHLDTLVGLRNLKLSSTQVTCEGLKYLVELPLLEHIERWSGRISDEGMRWISSLPHLQRAFLPDSIIDEESLRHLANTKSLTQLVLSDTSISDEAVPHLCKMPAIKTLWVDGTRLSQQGIAKLREGLPHAKVCSKAPDNTSEE